MGEQCQGRANLLLRALSSNQGPSVHLLEGELGRPGDDGFPGPAERLRTGRSPSQGPSYHLYFSAEGTEAQRGKGT